MPNKRNEQEHFHHSGPSRSRTLYNGVRPTPHKAQVAGQVRPAGRAAVSGRARVTRPGGAVPSGAVAPAKAAQRPAQAQAGRSAPSQAARSSQSQAQRLSPAQRMMPSENLLDMQAGAAPARPGAARQAARSAPARRARRAPAPPEVENVAYAQGESYDGNAAIENGYDDYEDDYYDDSYEAAARKGPSRVGRVLIFILIMLVAALLVVGIFVYFSYNKNVPNPGMKWDTAPVLPMQKAVDSAYLKETVFLGDSNMVRFGAKEVKGVTPNAWAAEGLGVSAVTGYAFLEKSGETELITMAQALEVMHPRRVLMCFGTNDIGNTDVDGFITAYAAAIDAIQEKSPGTWVVVSAIPSVGPAYTGGKVTPELVEQYNAALKTMCLEKKVPYLDYFDTINEENGFIKEQYVDADGLHLAEATFDAFASYYLAHPYQPTGDGLLSSRGGGLSTLLDYIGLAAQPLLWQN